MRVDHRQSLMDLRHVTRNNPYVCGASCTFGGGVPWNIKTRNNPYVFGGVPWDITHAGDIGTKYITGQWSVAVKPYRKKATLKPTTETHQKFIYLGGIALEESERWGIQRRIHIGTYSRKQPQWNRTHRAHGCLKFPKTQRNENKQHRHN